MAQVQQNQDLLKLDVPFSSPFKRTLFHMVRPSLTKLFCLPRLNAIYRQAACEDTVAFVDKVLDFMNIEVDLSPEDAARIPTEGPLVVVANHPFGAVEGLILTRVLRAIRPDVKIMANYLLKHIPEMRDVIISVDPFGTRESLAKNIGPLKDSMALLRQGGCLGVFPAGEVSALSLKDRAIADKAWSPTVGRIIRRTGAPVLPIFFSGSNRVLFHLLGLIHPRLRTVMLPRELVNKQSQTIHLRVGSLIQPGQISRQGSDEELMNYLRLRTYVLKNRDAVPAVEPGDEPFKPIVEAQDPAVLEAEIAGLAPHQILFESDEHLILCARRRHIPAMVEEIGRLREITFREVGEGTGQPTDLDRFDDTYHHLALWHKADRHIVGAYRLGPTDTILDTQGRNGLYCHTLFKLKKTFLKRVNPGLEMGRSFVLKRYQKSYAPLVLLWKGIAQFIVQHPQYKVLYGPVSISSDYHTFSRELLMRFLSIHEFEWRMAKMVKPKTPPKLKPMPMAGLEIRSARSVCRDIDDIAAIISDVETDRKGIPVLLRHYLKLGGKLLAFNVDQDFADALDGLIYVDLLKTDPRILARFMGKEQSKAFRAFHSQPETSTAS